MWVGGIVEVHKALESKKGDWLKAEKCEKKILEYLEYFE